MKAPPHKKRLAAAKQVSRAKPRDGKTPFISRAEARRRAERHVLKRIFGAAQVRDGAEAVLHIYIRGKWKNSDAWVVYKHPPGLIAIKASDVVLVCKRTGRVLYEGSAGDEG